MWGGEEGGGRRRNDEKRLLVTISQFIEKINLSQSDHVK